MKLVNVANTLSLAKFIKAGIAECKKLVINKNQVSNLQSFSIADMLNLSVEIIS